MERTLWSSVTQEKRRVAIGARRSTVSEGGDSLDIEIRRSVMREKET